LRLVVVVGDVRFLLALAGLFISVFPSLKQDEKARDPDRSRSQLLSNPL
jgi:hypothetical protein